MINQLEFIEHLTHIKEVAIKNKYAFNGYEVFGIDNDIDALNIYLTLTCIDMFSSIKHEPFEKWLLNNCKDFEQLFTNLKTDTF